MSTAPDEPTPDNTDDGPPEPAGGTQDDGTDPAPDLDDNPEK
jgi:hypothetical protein